jgi:DNA-binding transcriptional regulator YhcF (GntR family)
MQIGEKRAKSQILAQKIKKKIVSGQIAPGERLLSLRKFAERFDVNVDVMRNTFRLLENDGLIVRHQGSGTFVHPALKYNGTKLVALLTSYHKQDIEGYFEPLFEAANAANVLPLISTLDGTKDWQGSISKVIAREPDAVMIDVSAIHYPMKKIRELVGETPFCFVNRWEWDELQPANAVIVDYAKAYGKALKHLKDRGHRKILVVAYHIKPLPFMKKFLAEAGEIAGLSFDQDLIYYSREQLFESVESLKTIYDQQKPTAIFGLSDYLIHAVIKRGAKIYPESSNLEKIGFYDLKYSNIPGHEFSSMQIDFGKMWESALQMLNRRDHSVAKIVPRLICR